MTAYLIDTSVWIRILRGNQSMRESVQAVVDRGDVVVSCGFVTMELLAGVNRQNAVRVENLVDDMQLLAFDPRRDFASAARLSVRVRARGVAVRSLVDCLIASIALRHGGVVLAHCDSDFDRLAEVSSLRAERWDEAA